MDIQKSYRLRMANSLIRFIDLYYFKISGFCLFLKFLQGQISTSQVNFCISLFTENIPFVVTCNNGSIDTSFSMVRGTLCLL